MCTQLTENVTRFEPGSKLFQDWHGLCVEKGAVLLDGRCDFSISGDFREEPGQSPVKDALLVLPPVVVSGNFQEGFGQPFIRRGIGFLA